MGQLLGKDFVSAIQSKTFRNIVQTFALDKKAVLDIGCSRGEFLCNFGLGSVGITALQEEVEYGTSKGLSMRHGNIESDEFVFDQKFDVIFANNLFEHLYSPHNFLFKIKQYLKEDGLLILGVPCIPKFRFLLRLNKFRGSLALTHINFFDRDTLRKTVERGGWNVVASRGFHFMNKGIDRFFNLIYPHFYVVATVDESKSSREMKVYGFNSVKVQFFR